MIEPKEIQDKDSLWEALRSESSEDRQLLWEKASESSLIPSRETRKTAHSIRGRFGIKAALRHLNGAALIEVLVLLILALLVSYALMTGRALQWVHPRYQTWLWVSVPVLLLLALGLVGRLGEGLQRRRAGGLLILVLPLVALYLLLPPRISDAIQLERYVEPGLSQAAGGAVIAGALGGAGGDPALVSSDPAERIPNVPGSIALDGAHYAAWLAEVVAQPDKFEGKTYTYLSRIEQNPMNPSSPLILAGRPVMLCCAADAQSLGLYAQDSEKTKGKRGAWVYVTGTVRLGQGGNPLHPQEKGPLFEIKQVQEAPVPQSIYAYYYGSMKLPTEPMKAE